MPCRWYRAGALPLLLVVATHTSPAVAEQGHGTTTHWVEFEAGVVEVDGELTRIELLDDVAVTSGRFLLTGEHLVLTRGPRGVEVDGKGRVAMCPCDDPPVAVGFRAATIAPPTDLVLERATLRVGGVPVAAVPWLWLRSPRRLGILPPQLSWRAEDGLFGGAGVHVPLEPEDRSGRDFLDMRLGGYARPGFEARVDLLRRQHVMRARLDHVGATLLDLEGHGVSGPFAWRTDALRGPRANRGTPDLSRAVRRHDRLRVGVGRADATWVGGVGMRSELVRAPPGAAGGGTSFDDLGVSGPHAALGLSRPLAGSGAVRAGVDVRTLANSEIGDTSLVGERVGLRIAARPGPMDLVLDVGQDLLAVVTELDESALFASLGRLTVSAPLVREFGASPDPLVHWFEPGVVLQGGIDHAEGPIADGAEFGPLAGGVVRLQTALGHRFRRSAGDLVLDGGAVSDGGPARAIARAEARCSAALVGLGATVAWDPGSAEDVVVLGRGRVGRLDRVHLGAWVDGSAGEQPLIGRWVSTSADERPLAEWFDQDGWSAGGSIGLPVSRSVVVSSRVIYDLTRERLLAVRGGLRYLHPCHCVAVDGFATRRVGRDGLDLWVALDLIP